MTDMTAYAKRQTPGQKIHRLEWILETVRANQRPVSGILLYFHDGLIDNAKHELSCMYGLDRQALLQPNGILTTEQIELLK